MKICYFRFSIKFSFPVNANTMKPTTVMLLDSGVLVGITSPCVVHDLGL